MVHRRSNCRWLNNPARRVRPEHLQNIRRLALDLAPPEQGQERRLDPDHQGLPGAARVK
jgi:hypothetical protein